MNNDKSCYRDYIVIGLFTHKNDNIPHPQYQPLFFVVSSFQTKTYHLKLKRRCFLFDLYRVLMSYNIDILVFGSFRAIDFLSFEFLLFYDDRIIISRVLDALA
jgi:hypothetical protein